MQAGAKGRGNRDQESGVAQLARSAPQPHAAATRIETELTAPRAERGDGGVQPTLVEQKKKEVAPAGAPQAPTPFF